MWGLHLLLSAISVLGTVLAKVKVQHNLVKIQSTVAEEGQARAADKRVRPQSADKVRFLAVAKFWHP
ncbi:MAG: hypothetical protein A6F71_09830 [Cycloclasticus sp. symbiont of Poecilosclerida sp. M]|nr:MAG: hypothetical protein A6F71_09830 [Cycloclasticus sp. symbiont of Poecilosclerida sp. M]